MLLLVISFAKGFLRLSRRGSDRSLYTESDHQMLFQPIRITASAPKRYLTYALIFIAITIVGAVEIALLSQFGATILTGALLVTSTAIVRCALTTISAVQSLD